MKHFIVFIIILLAQASFSQPAKNLTDAKGKQGAWLKKYPGGTKEYEGFFVNDKPLGLFTYYYETGELKMKTLFKRDSISYATFFNKNESKIGEGKYFGKKKDSVWTYYDDRGILAAKESYVKGILDGKQNVYFLDGTIAKEITFVNGLEQGLCQEFFDNGQVKFKGNYIDGMLVDEVVFYYPNGNLKTKGFYRDGVKHDTWMYYREDGKEIAKEVYHFGNLKNQTIDAEEKGKIEQEMKEKYEIEQTEEQVVPEGGSDE